MTVPRPPLSRAAFTGGLRVPRLAKAGVVVVAIGLHADLVDHLFVLRPTPAGGFGPGEHLVHLVVLVGMVLVLAGVVADGARTAGGRPVRPEGSALDAVR